MATHIQGATTPSGLIPRQYRTEPSPGALPFIGQRASGGLHNWRVPPVTDYAQACLVGKAFALHYAQFLKDNPTTAGTNLLGQIAADIDFFDASGAKGYWVGFFSALEPMILAYARSTDVFGAAVEFAF